MRFIRSVLVSFMLFPGVAAAEGRFALFLGAKDYDHLRDLENPVEDAIAIADLLRGIGFEVTLETDRNADRTRRALEDFAEDADGADLALVYYAGHGAELRGVNHLLPTDTAHSEASGRLFRQHSVSHSGVSGQLRIVAA